MSSCNGVGPEAEYQIVPDRNNHAREPSVSTQAEYDVVPDKSDRPPPLPGPRQVTNNPVYETKGNTFSHPSTLKRLQDPPDAAEAEPDYKERDTWRGCILISLSILVVVGLLMAVASVCLVLVMWFGAYVPGCPDAGKLRNDNNCSCTSFDIYTELQELKNETSALSEQLRQLNSSFANISNISSADFTDLSRRAETLSMSVMNINSSCLNTLDEVRNTPVSLDNTTFRANLTNANIFGSCLYEYLSNCTMDIDTYSCETNDHPVTVDGYYNLEQTCHVAIQLGGSAARFAPTNNLVISGQEPNQIMKCSCAAVRVVPIGDRSATFTCFLFRARCPISSDFGVPIVKEI